MKRQPSIKSLRRRAVTAFNAWIRKRDANERGYGHCISCGKYAKLEAGHWLRSVHTSTRFREENVNGQCSFCNRFKDSEVEYHLAMIKKYGQAVVDELLALKHKTVKMTRQDYEELIKRYSG